MDVNDLAWRDETEEEKINQRIYKELTGPVYDGHAFSIRPPHPDCMNCGLAHEEALHKPCKEVENIPGYCSLGMVLMVEEAIEKRGLLAHYIMALVDVLGITGLDGYPPDVIALNMIENIWKFTRATPLQKCQAALKAIDSEV